jgi:DNA modification methylase
MPEGLAEFFIKLACPVGGIVIDPFAGGGTTIVVARRLGRKAAGFEIHEKFIEESRRRLAENSAIGITGYLFKVG